MANATRSTTEFKGAIPYFTACPHCGKQLKTVTVRVGGIEREVGCWGSCGCSDSEADYQGVADYERPYFAAGIPRRYIGAEADVDGYADLVQGGKSVYIMGPYGSGKTHFACALAKSLVDRGETVRFVNSASLVADIHATYDGHGTGLLDIAYGARVLVLDDLGKEQPTAHTLALFYELLDARYRDGKPLVSTSNFTRGELLKRWSAADMPTAESIISRLCEGSCVVEFNGADRRIS